MENQKPITKVWRTKCAGISCSLVDNQIVLIPVVAIIRRGLFNTQRYWLWDEKYTEEIRLALNWLIFGVSIRLWRVKDE